MNIRTGFIALALVTGGALAAYAFTAQSPEDQKKWTEFMTPGEAHKVLSDKAGKWTMKVKAIMAPGAPAEESTATAEIKWIMDGRYLEDHTEGSFGGMPFHGMGLSGYDNLKKKYCATWIDTLGTGIMVSEGTYDAAAKTLNYATEMPDTSQGKYVKGRMTEKSVDKDHWVMTMYSTGKDGKEFMSMEINYTRAK